MYNAAKLSVYYKDFCAWKTVLRLTLYGFFSGALFGCMMIVSIVTLVLLIIC